MMITNPQNKGMFDLVIEVKDVLDAGGLGVEVPLERAADLAERAPRHVLPSWILQRPQKLPR